MAAAVPGLEAHIWLTLYRAGGWWQPQEVGPQLPPDLDVDPRILANRLWVMAERRGSLRRREVQLRKGRSSHMTLSEYAVTPECAIPLGLSVRDLQL